MASKELTETIEMRTKAVEDKMLSLLDRRIEYLNNELKIRLNCSFKKTEPDFEYENNEEYLEHLKEGLKLSIEEELISVQKTIDGIYNTKSEREEINNLRNE